MRLKSTSRLHKTGGTDNDEPERTIKRAGAGVCEISEVNKLLSDTGIAAGRPDYQQLG